jgi:hypothetical protein
MVTGSLPCGRSAAGEPDGAAGELDGAAEGLAPAVGDADGLTDEPADEPGVADALGLAAPLAVGAGVAVLLAAGEPAADDVGDVVGLGGGVPMVGSTRVPQPTTRPATRNALNAARIALPPRMAPR